MSVDRDDTDLRLHLECGKADYASRKELLEYLVTLWTHFKKFQSSSLRRFDLLKLMLERICLMYSKLDDKASVEAQFCFSFLRKLLTLSPEYLESKELRGLQTACVSRTQFREKHNALRLKRLIDQVDIELNYVCQPDSLEKLIRFTTQILAEYHGSNYVMLDEFMVNILEKIVAKGLTSTPPPAHAWEELLDLIVIRQPRWFLLLCLPVREDLVMAHPDLMDHIIIKAMIEVASRPESSNLIDYLPVSSRVYTLRSFQDRLAHYYEKLPQNIPHNIMVKLKCLDSH